MDGLSHSVNDHGTAHAFSGHALARLAAIVMLPAVLLLAAVPAGCGRPAASQTGTAVDHLPTIIPALSPDLQDACFKPSLTWLKPDSRFAAWGTQPVSDGWIAAGEYYSANQGRGARLEYYNEDGSLRWRYQKSLSAYDSSYQCAVRLSDGGIIAGGRTSDGVDPNLALLTAFDPSGQIRWEKELDEPDDPNIGLSIVHCMQAADGRILVVADSDLFYIPITEGTQPTVLFCFNPDGSLAWRRKIDFSGMAYGQAAVPDDAGGFYLAVNGFVTRTDLPAEAFSWLLRISGDGSERWRKDLVDPRYQYQAAEMTLDTHGNLLLSCTANYLGEIPTPPAQSEVFSDRYQSYSYHPATLLKLDAAGNLIWQAFVNGRFGAAGQDVVFADGMIFWKAKLTDDIVKPYIFMSTDHRAICHDVLAVLDETGEQVRYFQFSREESANGQIQRVIDGQPALIGWEPVKEDPSWIETIPEVQPASPIPTTLDAAEPAIADPALAGGP